MNGTRYRNYLLGVLLTILTFNQTDGLMLGLLLQDIKADLHLTDTQLGLLSGFAFAFFYSVMGIPIARWADRGNRVTIISLTAAVWSFMVALCGTATSFGQLLLIRFGVAIGEAGCMPAAQSLIADHFVREERPRAMGIYLMGTSLSTVLGYFLAGWLNQMYGWRMTFILLGLPGLALAALARFTLKEPRHRDPPSEESRPRLRDVWRSLWANLTFRHLLLCFSVTYFFAFGIQQWQPAFLMRSYGLNTGELGTWLALLYGAGGLLGTYLGGALASSRAANNERLQLRVMALAYCVFALLWMVIYLTSSRSLTFALMGLGAVGIATTSGPLFATLQTFVPAPMRATAIAIVFLFANLIGMGLGPLAAGVLSDGLRPALGEESLRYSLLALCPGYFWGGWHLWRASRTIVPDPVT
jgi:predicted MFS family arabinose efflux permease